jgi:hypothetical protein
MIDPYMYWKTSTKEEKGRALCVLFLSFIALIGWGLYFDSQGGGYICESGCLNMLELEYGHPIPEAYHGLYSNCSMKCRGIK